MKYDVAKPWTSQSPPIPLLATALLTYHPLIKCLVCAMAKECDLFSFELDSNMLNLHWNGDAFNQRCVISPRSGVCTYLSVTKTAKSDHPCIGRKMLFFFCFFLFVPYSLKGLQFWLYGRLNTCKRLYYIARFWISAIVPNCQHYFNWHLPWPSVVWRP